MTDALKGIVTELGFPLLLLGIFMLIMILFLKRQRAKGRYSPLTENMLRSPAHSLRNELNNLDDKMYLGINLMLFPAIVVFVALRDNGVAWIMVAMMVAVGLVLLLKTFEKALRLRLAIDGEEYTGSELNYLMRTGAWVFHDIPYQYGNIDHLIVSNGGVFAVETKAIRKPAVKGTSSREAKVEFNGKQLGFPHFRSVAPIKQAQRHAKFLSKALKENLGVTIPVTAVVALPGWYIERTTRSDVWVINPKRGGALAGEVQKNNMSVVQAERIAQYIESVVRSVPAGSKRMDPDAGKYYDFWNNRRYEEPKI